MGDEMKRLILFIALVSLTILACGVQPAPTAPHAPAPQPKDAPTQDHVWLVVCNTGGLGLVLRSEPGTQFDALGELQDGEIVRAFGDALKVEDTSGAVSWWYEIDNGYVSALYLCGG